jgi:GNAT superfamily N-acetyltransferase
MSEHTFDVVVDPSDELVDEIKAGIVAYNDPIVGPSGYQKFAVTVKQDDKLIAGAWAEIYFGWLFISHLFVDEAFRGNGLGSRLLEQTEDYARSQGCKSVWLETFSFQAKPFYEKHGYKQFGEQDDYPPGYKHHFLNKSLLTSS